VVIAIDGPAGAGKSGVARGVAAALGFTYLDTGAMYRAVGLAARERGVGPGQAAREARIELRDAVRLDGRDVSAEIRTPQASEDASRAAADPEVRAALVARQREILASGGDWVAEGRDIATVVAPGAELKVFLTASPEERARRRAADLGADPAEVLADLAARDARDEGHGRTTSVAAPGAVTLDTTGLSLAEVVEEVVAMLKPRSAR